jgi:hypothetical protein
MSMCLDLECWEELEASDIAPLLSTQTRKGMVRGMCAWVKDMQSQRPSWMHALRAMYSASVDKSAMVFCFLEFQSMRHPAKNQMNPVTKTLSGSPAQSESENPVSVLTSRSPSLVPL